MYKRNNNGKMKLWSTFSRYIPYVIGKRNKCEVKQFIENKNKVTPA